MTPASDVQPRRVYLDNAATSWPKPPAVLDAAEKFMRECGATAGRGAYRSALLAERWLTDARYQLAQLLGAADGHSIALCSSGTHALNSALWGLLRAGDHVITSATEHNSLLRPLKQMETQHGIRLSVVPSDVSGTLDLSAAAEAVCDETRWIAVGHASNVTGRILPLEPWRALAQQAGARLLVDASQTLGYIPIDVQASGIDVLAAAGHKGLRGLSGTGLLMVASPLQQQLRPMMFGGTGSASEQLQAGQAWPQSVEVGNLNLPAIVSMAVAAAELNASQDGSVVEATGAQYASWRAPFEQLVTGLRTLPGVRLIGWPERDDPSDLSVGRIPVVSLQVAGWDVHDLANVLDSSFGIEVRAGWHCAALVHDALGTAASGGTLRLSPGASTTSEEIEWTLAAFREILG